MKKVRFLHKMCIGIIVLMLLFTLYWWLMVVHILPIPLFMCPGIVTSVSASGFLFSADIAGMWARFWHRIDLGDSDPNFLKSIHSSYCIEFIIIFAISMFEGFGWDMVIAFLCFGGVILWCELGWRYYCQVVREK